jgi:succinate dehydrogenase hydrophobic anchor subunit
MSSRVRNRLNVILQMVTALIVVALLGQLWLFTVTLDAMENGAVSGRVTAAAAICSLLACGSIWTLIRYFLRTEGAETGER